MKTKLFGPPYGRNGEAGPSVKPLNAEQVAIDTLHPGQEMRVYGRGGKEIVRYKCQPDGLTIEVEI